MKRKALGKGLEALIKQKNVKPSLKKYQIVEIEIDKIQINPEQPRENIEQESIKALSESIKSKGLLQPIIVKKNNGNYIILAGERRYRACLLAGLKKIPAIIKTTESKEDDLIISLIENIHRENLTPIEEAKVYLKLVKKYKLTHEQISKLVGKERSTITNYLRVLKLPVLIHKFLHNGELSIAHCKELLKLKSPIEQVDLAKKVVKFGWSVRKLSEVISSKKRVKRERILPPHLSKLQEELIQRFQTKVQIEQYKKKGKIIFEYYSEEELIRLMDLFKINI